MEAVISEHETALLRYAGRILRDATAAQDVVQNVFIRLYRRWDESLMNSDGLKTWLFRATHNEAVDEIRRQSRLRLLHERREAQSDVLDGGESGEALSHEEKKALVLDQLRRLHPREQQVICLRLEQGLSYDEISRVTGRTQGNVGNILHHAVRKLSLALRRAGAIA